MDTPRKRRKAIPKALKDQVWNTNVAPNVTEGKCWVCKKPIHIQDFEVGHNKAVSKGGKDTLDNLKPICGTCNRSMGTRSIKSFQRHFPPGNSGLPRPSGAQDTDFWRKWYDDHRREDSLVVLDDLLPILGREKFEQFVQSNHEHAQVCLNKAYDYIRASQRGVGIVDPEEHQRVADSISACAIALLVEDDPHRRGYLHQMIKDSEGCARTNYQFVRIFLRRNFAGLLDAHGLSLADFPTMFPADVIDVLQEGQSKKIIAATKNWIIRHKKPIVGTLNVLASLCRLVTMGKGEFTHFEEVFPVLQALSKAGLKLKLGVLVCEGDRFNYINEKLGQEAPNILCRKKDFKVFRYYVFPAEYILLLSGDPKQFLIFWGRTKPNKSAAALLSGYDWKTMIEENQIVIAD